MGRWLFIVCVTSSGQVADPAFPILEKAYAALRAHDYDRAIVAFTQALSLEPARGSIHKDLAYTLLKTGETEAARAEFAAAMSLEPADDHAAREYAFLFHAPSQISLPPPIFDGGRNTGD